MIAGFGRPNWSLVGEDASSCETESPTDEIPDEDRQYIVLMCGDGVDKPLPEVKAWQNLLLCWGFDLGPYGADGEFGSMTKNVTIQFQQKVGLEPTGVVHEDEWKQAIYIG